MYVSDCTANAIDVFAPGATGNVAPERSIQGSDTGLSNPCDVQVDSAGDVYAADLGNGSITEYAPQALGDAKPICTISGSNTGLTSQGIDDFSLEADGTLVVGTYDNNSVLVFAPSSCGNVAPVESIAGSNTGFNIVDGVGTDAPGTIYAASSENNSINVFPAGTNGNVAPKYTIAGADTGLSGPDDMVVGFGGELYVSSGFLGSQTVTVYAPGASGDAVPIQDITGSATGFNEIDDLAVDDVGNIYVTDLTGVSVDIFAAGATGNVAPTAVIAGSNTTFVEPEGVAVAGPSTPPPTITTSPSASSISLGASVSDTATLSGGISPTGSLEFKLFGPNDKTCSAAPAFTSPFSKVTGDGSYPSPSFTPTAKGTYSWVALYSGDTKNAPVSTACSDPAETVTVGSGNTTTTTTTSLSGGGQSGTSISVPMSTAVTDTATLSGTNAATATGTITYSVYSDSACSVSAGSGGTVTVSGPSVPASRAVTLATPGTYYWQASYSGDSKNLLSTSTCGTTGEVETVTNPNTMTSLVTSLSGGGKSGTTITVPQNTPVTDLATLSGTNAATATGTVTYHVYSDRECDQSLRHSTVTVTDGKVPASDAKTMWNPGTYYWQASYSGDANNKPSASRCGDEIEIVKARASTNLTTKLLGTGKWANFTLTVTAGTPVSDSAKLHGDNISIAGGTVTYTVYSDVGCYQESSCKHTVVSTDTETVTNGIVSNSSPITLSPGIYSWQASYSGDALNKASASVYGTETLAVHAAKT